MLATRLASPPRPVYFIRAFAICLFVGALISNAQRIKAADEWPQFRGPDGQGHASSGSFPTLWSENENIAWKTALPGKGWSSPVISEGLVWVTSAETVAASDAEQQLIRKQKLAGNPLVDEMVIVSGIKLFALVVDLKSGELKKRIELFELKTPEPVHSLNSYASPTPVVERGRVYCHFGTFGVAAIDSASGDVLWRKTLPISHSVGPGSSPAVHKNVLIVPCDGTDEQYVAGLNGDTGEILWKTKRPTMTGSAVEMHKSFCTPLLIEASTGTQVIVPGAQWIVAYDPKNGHELWRLHHGDGFSLLPRPVVADDLLFFCTGYMKPELQAVRLGGTGDVSDTGVVWKSDRQIPTMSSPVVVGTELYVISEGGVITCFDSVSGATNYQKRIGGNFSSSPLAAGDKLYFSSREGKTTVLRAGKQFELIAENLLDGQIMASPAAVDGKLILRTQSHLYAIGK